MIKSLTYNVANEIAYLKDSDREALLPFFKYAGPKQFFEFRHWNFFYSNPAPGKFFSNMPHFWCTHKLILGCSRCEKEPNRGSAGIATIYLVNTSITPGRMQLVCKRCLKKDNQPFDVSDILNNIIQMNKLDKSAFERMKSLLKVKEPKDYKPATNRIKGEKLLPRYNVVGGVVQNEDDLYYIKMDKKRVTKNIHIEGAETSAGRWISTLARNFSNGGGCGPLTVDQIKKMDDIFETKQDAIIYMMGRAIEYCDQEKGAFEKRIKRILIADRDELIEIGICPVYKNKK